MRVLALAALVFAAVGAREAGAQSFTNFESGHVRPLAMSPDGSRLFAVNTTDNRLAIYAVGVGSLTLEAEVQVGLEPVAVAARSNTEAWVVNHLSDSISIVQVDTVTPSLSRVTRTLHTCDEPRDIVFAGTGGNRAFVTAARRGQNCPVAPNFTTAGTGRALVQVWDAAALGGALGGTPIANIVMFGDTPRGLARSTDASMSRVYAGVFHSGNRTTAINETIVTPNGQGLPPDPPESVYATPKPPVGLIVKFDTGSSTWKDERPGSNWNAQVPFTLPDRDVFIIDANAPTPQLLASSNNVVGVGTILFNMAVRPNAGGQIYVANLDARNHVRFEPRIPSTGGGVQGNIVQSRITVINGTTPTARHLNPHIDYTCVPPSCANDLGEIEQSLAFPMDLQFSSNGSLLYVVGFGSEKVGIFDAAQLEAGVINGSTKNLVEVGGGPSGLALDEGRNQLYVMNRFDGTISIVGNANTPASAAESSAVPLRFDPAPTAARVGRRFLYDARDTSAHGDQACASCHIFGDMDDLAWDLSNPLDPNVEPNDNGFRLAPGNNFSFGGPGVGVACPNCEFHPMKGPMTTQTLRGMAGAGPMHWRGDRTGASTGGDPLDEDLAFKAFNPAFVGLLGRDMQLTAGEMQQFTDFILTVALPPNPARNLDDTLNTVTPSESAGSSFFLNTGVDGGLIQCDQCHLNPLGTDGLSSFEGEPQEFKIAHLRNLYQKIGMFGSSGDQIRGFGFLHDGSVDTMFTFFQAPVFNFGSGTTGNNNRRNVEAFMLVFDAGQAPAVGQQVTVTPANVADTNVINRIATLIARDDASRCDLTVKGSITNVPRGWVYVGGNAFQPDRNTEGTVNATTLRNQAGTAGQELTYTCVPLGSGTRIGVDRDLDGTYDRRELDCGTDPANASSVSPPTGSCGSPTTSTTSTTSSTSTSTSNSSTSSTSSSTSTSTSTPTSSSSSSSTSPPTLATTSSTSSSTSSSSSTSPTTTSSSSTSTSTTAPGATTSSTSSSTSTSSTSSSSTSSSTSTSSTSSSTSTSAGPTTSSTSSTTSSSTSSTTTSTLPIVRIQSTTLTLKDRTSPPDPNRRRIAFKSSTTTDAAPNQIAVPARATAGDPTPGGSTGGGATVQVYNSNGSGEVTTVVLPASGWSAMDDAPNTRGYKYKGAATDPITRITIRGNLLRVRGGKANWTYTLNEASQGRMAVRVTMGSAFQWCADSPAKTSGNPPSTASNDRVDKFVGARKTPAPAVCPAVP